jgi:hypothetical chaperone protein
MMRGMTSTLEVPSSYYHDLTTWHTLNTLYNHKTQRELKAIYNHSLDKKLIYRLLKVTENQQGHKILNAVEQGKCYLSQSDSVNLDLGFIEPKFNIGVERTFFEDIISEKVNDLVKTITDTIVTAGVKVDQIDSIFFTGGSTQIPIIRQKIMEPFPKALKVQGDVFSSVGKGLIIDAQRKFL